MTEPEPKPVDCICVHLSEHGTHECQCGANETIGSSGQVRRRTDAAKEQRYPTFFTHHQAKGPTHNEDPTE
jgi:hypothetical protein